MPELIRSVVSRMRLYVKNRRQSPRLRIRLLFSVSVCRSTNGNGSHHERVLKGHTRDISVNGLALNVPQVHLDGHHLAAGERELQLRLELPDGPISMLVIPKRYERLEESELGCNYLIGAQISQIDDEDRRRYLSFIAQSFEATL
jgi:PilZ domain